MLLPRPKRQTVTAPRCPCGHPLDPDGDPDQYGCLNGLIYGPCGDGCCYGRCSDSHGTCKSLDGCCDPEERDDD